MTNRSKQKITKDIEDLNTINQLDQTEIYKTLPNNSRAHILPTAQKTLP